MVLYSSPRLGKFLSGVVLYSRQSAPRDVFEWFCTVLYIRNKQSVPRDTFEWYCIAGSPCLGMSMSGTVLYSSMQSVPRDVFEWYRTVLYNIFKIQK